MSRALVIVDYQNDFAAPDGALSVPGAEVIAPRINELAASGDFAVVVATRDWHPADHGSFVTSDSAGPWPVHCVAGTPGAELHPALARDCERAVREGRMSVAESQGIKRFYEGELNGYAYLE